MGPHCSIAIGLIFLGIGVYSQELLNPILEQHPQLSRWIIENKESNPDDRDAENIVPSLVETISMISKTGSLEPRSLEQILPVNPFYKRLKRSPKGGRGGGRKGGGGKGGKGGGGKGGKGGKKSRGTKTKLTIEVSREVRRGRRRRET